MSDIEEHIYDVIVVGAGAAGVGIGVALVDADVENFLVVDRYEVGASFDRWPAETCFISPSFATNSIGMLDLNSIAIGVSPAHNLTAEHPTGAQFAAHLRVVADYFELPIQAGIDVQRVAKIDDLFVLDTPRETLRSRNVIWAAGEFQYPNRTGFPGVNLCQHTATVPSYERLEGDDFIIIGGYESGIDAAYHLADFEKSVRLFDRSCPWKEESSDPSIALSTFSLERMQSPWFEEHVELFPDCGIESVALKDDGYEVATQDGRMFTTTSQPLLASGFQGSLSLVSDLFEKREDGFPVLSEHDESTLMPGLFLSGPAVRHDGHVFCFIYKFRQRFAVVAKKIATSLGLEAEGLEMYRKWGMYLDDLSCCGEECIC